MKPQTWFVTFRRTVHFLYDQFARFSGSNNRTLSERTCLLYFIHSTYEDLSTVCQRRNLADGDILVDSILLVSDLGGSLACALGLLV